jgi:hypothetical protein
MSVLISRRPNSQRDVVRRQDTPDRGTDQDCTAEHPDATQPAECIRHERDMRTDGRTKQKHHDRSIEGEDETHYGNNRQSRAHRPESDSASDERDDDAGYQQSEQVDCRPERRPRNVVVDGVARNDRTRHRVGGHPYRPSQNEPREAHPDCEQETRHPCRGPRGWRCPQRRQRKILNRRRSATSGANRSSDAL